MKNFLISTALFVSIMAISLGAISIASADVTDGYFSGEGVELNYVNGVFDSGGQNVSVIYDESLSACSNTAISFVKWWTANSTYVDVSGMGTLSGFPSPPENGLIDGYHTFLSLPNTPPELSFYVSYFTDSEESLSGLETDPSTWDNECDTQLVLTYTPEAINIGAGTTTSQETATSSINQVQTNTYHGYVLMFIAAFFGIFALTNNRR